MHMYMHVLCGVNEPRSLWRCTDESAQRQICACTVSGVHTMGPSPHPGPLPLTGCTYLEDPNTSSPGMGGRSSLNIPDSMSSPVFLGTGPLWAEGRTTHGRCGAACTILAEADQLGTYRWQLRDRLVIYGTGTLRGEGRRPQKADTDCEEA